VRVACRRGHTEFPMNRWLTDQPAPGGVKGRGRRATLGAASREARSASVRANGGSTAVSRHPLARSAPRGSGPPEGVQDIADPS